MKNSFIRDFDSLTFVVVISLFFGVFCLSLDKVYADDDTHGTVFSHLKQIAGLEKEGILKFTLEKYEELYETVSLEEDANHCCRIGPKSEFSGIYFYKLFYKLM